MTLAVYKVVHILAVLFLFTALGSLLAAAWPGGDPAHADGSKAVRKRAGLIKAIGHRQRAAVIRDGDVTVAKPPCPGRHRLEIVAAVGGGGVHVEIAAEIRLRDQLRERS